MMMTNKYPLPPLPEPLCNLPTYCQDAVRQYTRSVLDDHLNEQDAAIEAALASPEIKTMQCMAECMDMVRAELIELGVIGKNVPPMFVASAVFEHVQALRKDAERLSFIESEGGADIVRLSSDEWEVSGIEEMYGTGHTLREAIDAAIRSTP